MIKTSCSKIVLRNDDLREYEKAKASWEQELKNNGTTSKPREELIETTKSSRTQNINQRIGLINNKS